MVGNNSNAAFYSISNGKICRQFKNPTAKSILRVNMNGRTVHEEFYDYINGVITNVKSKETDYGKIWEIVFDGGEILQFQYSSGYSQAFLKCFPNINLSIPVTLTPKLTIEGEKKKSTLFVNQNGAPIKWAYTKENPNGLPELKQVKIKGKLTWDDSDIMEFLEAMVNEKFNTPLPIINEDKEGEEILPF